MAIKAIKRSKKTRTGWNNISFKNEVNFIKLGKKYKNIDKFINVFIFIFL